MCGDELQSLGGAHQSLLRHNRLLSKILQESLRIQLQLLCNSPAIEAIERPVMETAQESLTERRRRQNRLNQQARRKRLADEANAKGPAQKWIIYSASAVQEADGARTSEKHAHLCQRMASDRNRWLEKLRKDVAHNFLRQSLNAEALVSVTRYNIYQAMMVNATYLGLTIELLREDIISPFNVIGPATFGLGAGNLPPSLRPTALQRQIVHHPWVDVCPMPSLRDALLLGAAAYDEDELCHDLFLGAGSDSEHQAGLVVWGESWDPTACFGIDKFLAGKEMCKAFEAWIRN